MGYFDGFTTSGLLVLLHVLFATLWFGGAVYQVRLIGPALMAAGPAGGGFQLALAKRKGIGWYFALTGLLTIVFGGALYGSEKVYNDPFGPHNVWLTSGAIIAVLAYLHGMAVNLPAEKKWLAVCNSVKGAPTPEQGKQMAELGQKIGKAGRHSVMMLAVAILLMLLARVFPG